MSLNGKKWDSGCLRMIEFWVISFHSTASYFPKCVPSEYGIFLWWKMRGSGLFFPTLYPQETRFSLYYTPLYYTKTTCFKSLPFWPWLKWGTLSPASTSLPSKVLYIRCSSFLALDMKSSTGPPHLRETHKHKDLSGDVKVPSGECSASERCTKVFHISSSQRIFLPLEFSPLFYPWPRTMY